ncbi:MAG: HAD family hydrolase [Clostridiales bacterium]|nr:HAD family hydrolase [Clostridiales bacterium]
MNEKDTVIFDLDGTLLDTLDDLMNSVNYALKAYGCPLRSREEIRQFVGNGILNLMTRAVPSGQDHEAFSSIFESFREHYGVHCNDLTKPYDGIMDLIRVLNENHIKMAIVSNKADFAVKELAEIYFKGTIPVAIGEKESEGIRKKPAPDMVLAALKELDSDVAHAVYVGDSEVDLLTADHCGMDYILCEWGFRERGFLEEKGGRIFVKHPLEIADMIL